MKGAIAGLNYDELEHLIVLIKRLENRSRRRAPSAAASCLGGIRAALSRLLNNRASADCLWPFG